MSAPILQIPLAKKEYLVTYTITPKNRYYNRLYEPIGNTLDLSKDPSYWLSPPVYTVEPVSYNQLVNGMETAGSYDLLANCDGSNNGGMLNPVKLYVDNNDGTLIRSRFGPIIFNFPWFNHKINTNLTKLKIDAYVLGDLQYNGGGTWDMSSYLQLFKNESTLLETYIKNGTPIYAGDNSGWVKAELTSSTSALSLYTSKNEGSEGLSDDTRSYSLPDLNAITTASDYIQIKGINTSASSPDHSWNFNSCDLIVTTFGVNIQNSTGYTITPFIGKYRTVKNQPNTPMSSYFSDPEVKAVTNGNDELFPSSGTTGKDGWIAPGAYMTNVHKIDLPMSSFNPNTGGFNRLHVQYSQPVPVSPSAFSYGFYKLIPIVLDTFYIVSFYARSMTNSYLWVNMNAATNFDGGSTSSHNNIALNNKWTLYTLKCKATSTTSSPLVFYANLLYTGGSYACDFELGNVSVKYKNNQDFETDECYQDVYTYTENIKLTSTDYYKAVYQKNEGQYLPYPNKNIVGTYTLNDSNGIFTGNSITTLTGYDSINNVTIPSTIIRS